MCTRTRLIVSDQSGFMQQKQSANGSQAHTVRLLSQLPIIRLNIHPKAMCALISDFDRLSSLSVRVSTHRTFRLLIYDDDSWKTKSEILFRVLSPLRKIIDIKDGYLEISDVVSS